MGLFAKLLGIINVMSTSGSESDSNCIILFYDEPECPKSIIEK